MDRVLASMLLGAEERKEAVEGFLRALPPPSIAIEQLYPNSVSLQDVYDKVAYDPWNEFKLFKYVIRLISFECCKKTVLAVLSNVLKFKDWAVEFVCNPKNGPNDLLDSLGKDFITRDHSVINALIGNFVLDEDREDLQACFNLVLQREGAKHYITRYAWCLAKHRNADTVRIWVHLLPADLHRTAINMYNFLSD